MRDGPPGSSLHAGPVVASEETRLGPAPSASRHSADAQRPRRRGKALYFPVGHGVAGHPGNCSLQRLRHDQDPRETWSTTDADSGLAGAAAGLGVDGIVKGEQTETVR